MKLGRVMKFVVAVEPSRSGVVSSLASGHAICTDLSTKPNRSIQIDIDCIQNGIGG